MESLPEEYELLGFFEFEPTNLEPDIPWFYKELNYKSKSSNGFLETKIEASYGKVEFKWYQNESLVLHLNLVGISKIEVGNSDSEIAPNTLRVSFKNSSIESLNIRIRPFISFIW